MWTYVLNWQNKRSCALIDKWETFVCLYVPPSTILATHARNMEQRVILQDLLTLNLEIHSNKYIKGIFPKIITLQLRTNSNCLEQTCKVLWIAKLLLVLSLLSPLLLLPLRPTMMILANALLPFLQIGKPQRNVMLIHYVYELAQHA